MTLITRQIAVGLIATSYIFYASHTGAAKLPEDIKKPDGAQIEPVKKTVCKHKISDRFPLS